MNTIKSGKLFCDKYNSVNKTQLSPKEIFSGIIAPILFYGEKHLTLWANSSWFSFFVSKKNKFSDENFKLVLDNFCTQIEDDSYNVMTSCNVFGGCAIPQLKQTTMFCYSDNLYFNIDERYYSFIGAAFAFQCEGWYVIVNNTDLIWKLFEGIKQYRKIIDENSHLYGNQLYAWNSAYLTSIVRKDKVSNIIDEFFTQKDSKGFKININPHINFINFLFYISKLTNNLRYISVFRLDKTNTTCGEILINLDYVKRMSDMYKKVYKEPHENFNPADFNRSISKNINLKLAVEIGSVYEGFLNPLNPIYEKLFEEKFKLKFIEFIMSDNEKELAKSFAQNLKNIVSESKTNIHIEKFFKEHKLENLIQFITGLEHPNLFIDVVEYLTSNTISKDNINIFIKYTEFHFNLKK